MRSPLLCAAFFLAGSVVAAPQPNPGPAVPLEKYLIDDADFVLVLNVKGIAASPLFAKGLKKPATDFLTDFGYKEVLKGTGIDVLRDLERVVVVVGRSCYVHIPDEGYLTTPVILFQGKFDQKKLEARFDKIAARPGIRSRLKGKPFGRPTRDMTVTKEGNKKIYCLNPDTSGSCYLAVLDKTTVVASRGKDHVKQLWARADGTRKAKLTYAKEWAPHLKTFKPKLAVHAVALREMVWRTHEAPNPEGAATWSLVTLGDLGIPGFTLTVTGKDEALGKVVIAVQDKANLAKVSARIVKELEQGKKDAVAAKAFDPEWKPHADAIKKVLDTVKTTKKNTSLQVEGKAGADALRAFVRLLLLGLPPQGDSCQE